MSEATARRDGIDLSDASAGALMIQPDCEWCGALCPDDAAIVAGKIDALLAERDRYKTLLEQIEDQAGRAALVQDRSVRIIKQVCASIARDARAALATTEGR